MSRSSTPAASCQLALLILLCLLQSASSSAQAPQPPADAKTLPCPTSAGPINLASGTWSLPVDCSIKFLTLTNDAQLYLEGRSLTIDGDIQLSGTSALHIHGGTLTIANRFKFQYRIVARNKAVLDIRDATVSTNAGVAANLTSNYLGSDDSLLHLENVQTDKQASWLLANLHDRARLETRDSPHFPGEIYPADNSTITIAGPRSAHQVWLRFNAGASAVLDGLPNTHPFTFSFGRNTPGVTGVGFQVDVVNGYTGFSITSFPGSKVTVKDSIVGIGLEFADVTTPETISGLKGGNQTANHRNDDRAVDLENATLPPYGWQVYSSNSKIAPASRAPVTVTNSLINEMGASDHGWFEADNVQFAFAAVAAQGPGSKVDIRNSVLNSHTIMANNDGVMQIEDSEIYGSRIQAIGHSRILLLNTALLRNEPNPKCIPVFPSLDGKPRTRCNPYNPSTEVQFTTQGDGLIEAANLDRIPNPVPAGTPLTFQGDAIVKTSADAPYTYNLRYRPASGSNFTAIVTAATGPKRAQPLGQLDTRNLAAGEYILELQLLAPGQEPIAVQRPFNITEPR